MWKDPKLITNLVNITSLYGQRVCLIVDKKRDQQQVTNLVYFTLDISIFFGSYFIAN